MRRFLLILLLFSINFTLHAQEFLKPLSTEQPPVIDGNLDDAVWSSAPSITGLKTFHPDYGHDMAERTEVFLAYDRENLYFAFRCYDSQPDRIKTSITSRDNIKPDDWICINLDTFNDKQSLYGFYVNPLGIQMDTRYAGGVEDPGFDLVWYSGGQIDEKGYTVEVRIPLKSIRYANTNPVEMAVIFERHISRNSTYGTFPALSPDQGMAFLTQMQSMKYYDLKQHTLFELLPAVTYSHKQSIDQGKLATDENLGDISLTTKYGITSDLILDGTYNPDFSQIEADAGQVDVNLRYDLYFPEKRPFFLEGSEHFQLGGLASSIVDPLQKIVHTRAIVDPVVGIKLSGKIGKKSTLASIAAVDDLPEIESGEDKAYFTILRYKHALNQDSYIGGIYAGRELKNGFNRVLGLDGQLRTNQSAMADMHAFLSQTKNDASGSGSTEHAIGLKYSYGTRNLDYNFGIKDISENFRADMGYIIRTGVRQFHALLRHKTYPDSPYIQRIDAEGFTSHTLDKFSGLWETLNYLSFQYLLFGQSLLKMKYYYSTEVFLAERFLTGGFHVLITSQVTKKFYFAVLYRYNKAIYYSTDPYQGWKNRLTTSLFYQPSDYLQSELSFVYSDFYRDSDSKKIYEYPITRGKLTYQLNKYLFFRGIVEYNAYRKEMLTDFLASFTYIPGTVIHIGYGSIYDKTQWNNGQYRDSDRFLEIRRGFFFKTSYLWRL